MTSSTTDQHSYDFNVIERIINWIKTEKINVLKSAILIQTLYDIDRILCKSYARFTHKKESLVILFEKYTFIDSVETPVPLIDNKILLFYTIHDVTDKMKIVDRVLASTIEDIERFSEIKNYDLYVPRVEMQQ